MLGTITDPRVATALGEACGTAALATRNRLERSARKEKQGQGATREETYTDDLVTAIDELGSSLQECIKAAPGVLSASQNVRIEFLTEKAPQGEERDFGLDIGMRLIIDTPGYSAHKAILVQCKRMYGKGRSGEFPKLRGDGEEQARKMLRVSPASFFFLFNAGERRELLEMMQPEPFFPLLRKHWEPLWHDEYMEPGVAVLPATRVLAMSEAATASSQKLPVAAQDVLRSAAPLGHFIASMFGPCFLGDPRTPVLRLATPPEFRKTVLGLNAEVPELGHIEASRFYTLKVSKAAPTDGAGKPPVKPTKIARKPPVKKRAHKR